MHAKSVKMKIFVEYDSKIVQLNVPAHTTVSELVKLSKEEFGITGPSYTLFFNRTDKVGDPGASLTSAGIIENMRLLLDKSSEVEKCSLTGGESEQLENVVNSILQRNCTSFEFLIEVTNAVFLQKHFKIPNDGPVLAPDWKEKANTDGTVRMNYIHPENSGKLEVVAIWFGRQSDHQFVEFVANNVFNNDCTTIRFTVKNLPDITSDNAPNLPSSFPFFGTGGPDDLNPLGGGIPRMPNIFPDYNEPPSFMGPLAPHGNRPRGPRYDPPFPYDTQGQIRLPRPGRGGPPSGFGNYFI
ncbi:hypothetical protein T10_6781 [Trichinella papuae]|uniref:Uncharacterized protein n=1 Tax=Trichinella papuae TaxID=268474 RepID=A0A0V1MTY0_9BILA|nr:hypothetical protein T10_6781 [Trichinella papuae]